MKNNIRELINGQIDELNDGVAEWYSPDEETGFVPAATAPSVYHFIGYIQAMEDIGAINSMEGSNILAVLHKFERGVMPHVTGSGNAERRHKE